MRIIAITEKVIKELFRDKRTLDVFSTYFNYVFDECYVFCE